MLRAALGTAFLSAVTNLNRNCKPTCTHFTADWNIPHVVARAFFPKVLSISIGAVSDKLFFIVKLLGFKSQLS